MAVPGPFDPGAVFTGLYVESYDALWRYAARFVGLDSAEDAVQQVFTRLWARRSVTAGFDRITESYLRVSVRNEAFSQLRKDGTRRKVCLASAAEVAPIPPEVSHFGGGMPSVPLHVIVCAIETLAPRTRCAFLLAVVHGLPHADITRLLGISPRTVEPLVRLARAKLRRLITDHHAPTPHFGNAAPRGANDGPQLSGRVAGGLGMAWQSRYCLSSECDNTSCPLRAPVGCCVQMWTAGVDGPGRMEFKR